MGDTNYFSGIVKILENPVQKLVKKKTLLTIIRVEIPQIRQARGILLILWGNLGNEIKNSYQKNDYILIEGYSSIKKINVELNNSKLHKIIITGLKIYPLLLTSGSMIEKKLN